VQLTSSDSAVTLPGSLTFTSGESQQSFSFALGSGFASSHLLAISAAMGGQTATAYFAKANANLKPGVIASIGETTMSTTSAGTTAGGSVELLLDLQSIEGYSGVFGQFACSGLPAGAQCDFVEPSVTLLPGGNAQVAFAITTASTTLSGIFKVTISASNSEISPAVSLSFSVGGFSLSINPAIILENASSAPSTTVTATYTNGFAGTIQLSCNGYLPPGAVCNIAGSLSPSSPSTTVTVNAGGYSANPQDYPFQVAGSSGNVSTSVNATVRVSSFSAALQSDSATVANGQAASFNVLLTSLNHFSNSNISLSCDSAESVTCTSSPQNASLADDGTAAMVLTVTPQIPVTVSKAEPLWTVSSRIALACIGLLIVPLRRRSRWGRYFALLLLCLVFGISACSGGGGGGGGGKKNPVLLTIGISAQAPTATGSLQIGSGSIALTVTQ
jgi:hypothetical protein